MLQDADGEPANAAGDSFVIHMDREALNDYPMGKYDVTVEIRDFEKDRLIAWTILGQIRPQIDKVYPLEEIVPALNAIARREVKGKAIIRIRSR